MERGRSVRSISGGRDRCAEGYRGRVKGREKERGEKAKNDVFGN